MKLLSLACTASLALPALAQTTPNATTREVQTYLNPVIWNDLPDLEVIRVNDTYYYTTSTFHYSPGAAVLRSYDLVNWEYIGHSVPRLDFNPQDAYDLVNGEQAYVGGIWASSLRHRPSDDLFYWIGCIQSNNTYIYTASDPAGEWELASEIENCYYDCGLLFDEDDSIYVAFGDYNISMAELNQDLTERRVETVYYGETFIEGARLYNINGTYYMQVTEPSDRQWTMKSTGDVWGPWEIEILADFVNSTIEDPGIGIPGEGSPHQGGIVDTPDGKWYYMAFVDAYPSGRIPVLAPLYFDSEGWPRLESNQSFEIPNPYPAPRSPTPSLARIDTFTGPNLNPQWEWNHNPVASAYSLGEPGGLKLETVTVTSDIFHARNTLTHRIAGPNSSAIIHLDTTAMSAGDRAGLALFRDQMAYIAYQDDTITLYRNLSLDAGWNTQPTEFAESTVSLASNASTRNNNIWFRLDANTAPASDQLATFYYSLDGEAFEQLGSPYKMNDTFFYFPGYRWGIFNFATEEVGGSVGVRSFEQVVPSLGNGGVRGNGSEGGGGNGTVGKPGSPGEVFTGGAVGKIGVEGWVMGAVCLSVGALFCV